MQGFFFFKNLIIYKLVVGEYAGGVSRLGGINFSLPNPVSIHREYLRRALLFWPSELQVEWCIRSLTKKKILGARYWRILDPK